MTWWDSGGLGVVRWVRVLAMDLIYDMLTLVFRLGMTS
jgi:hypothetical protein